MPSTNAAVVRHIYSDSPKFYIKDVWNMLLLLSRTYLLPHCFRADALDCSDATPVGVTALLVSISWPVTLVASHLLSLCSCLLL